MAGWFMPFVVVGVVVASAAALVVVVEVVVVTVVVFCLEHRLLLLAVSGWSLLLHARHEVAATWTDQHGRADQPRNKHLLHLLSYRHHRSNDYWRTHRPKDVF